MKPKTVGKRRRRCNNDKSTSSGGHWFFSATVAAAATAALVLAVATMLSSSSSRSRLTTRTRRLLPRYYAASAFPIASSSSSSRRRRLGSSTVLPSSGLRRRRHALRLQLLVPPPSRRYYYYGGGGGGLFFQRPFSALASAAPSSADDDAVAADVVVVSPSLYDDLGDDFKENSSNSNSPFRVTAPYEPTGDQPDAIAELLRQLRERDVVGKDDDDNNNKQQRFCVLKGLTGTGKTFVVSHVVAARGRPTLVLCHNKTLAAQLARELRSFLGESAVELFVSYYDLYVPESYKESTGTYRAKKSAVNAQIDALRHRATRALLTRSDVVVVASVSCIYGLGLPTEYLQASTEMKVGDAWSFENLVEQFETTMLYQYKEEEDNYEELERGQYRVYDAGHSKFLEVWPFHETVPLQILLGRLLGADTEDGQELYRIEAIRDDRPGATDRGSCRIFPVSSYPI